MIFKLVLTTKTASFEGVFDSRKEKNVFDTDLFSLFITRNAEPLLPEYEATLTAKKDFAPTEVALVADLCETLDDNAEHILFYDAAPGTNAFCGVKNLKAVRDNPSGEIFFAHNKDNTAYLSHDLFMAHGGKKDVSVASTTFDRFYTGFLCDGVTVRFFLDLEDKPLKAGTVLKLERFSVSDEGGLAFFEKYTDLLAKTYSVKPKTESPCGWSSWTCYANAVTDEKIVADSENVAKTVLQKGADLIQLDDGWEAGGPFSGEWVPDTGLFPDFDGMVRRIKELGLTFGIWTAPCIIAKDSAVYKEYEAEMQQAHGENIASFGGFYAMNVGREKVLDYVRRDFKKMHECYGADYFKIDFIGNILYRQGNGNTVVHFDDDYCVALYRRFLKTIRETVGDDVFLNGCGATMGESVGIFDGTRVTPDITWGGCGSDTHPGAFAILRMDASNCLYRSPYHNKLFVCDPDGLVLRGEELANGDDGLCLNYEEAKMRACSVAMSGGHVLLNENTTALPQEKYDLFADIVPTLGKAARPVDFWEMPYPTKSIIELDEHTRFYAFYNWSEEEKTLSVPLPEGEWHTVDCFTKQQTGIEKNSVTKTLEPHTCVAFLAKRKTNEPQFFYAPDGFFLGYATKGKKTDAVYL